MDMFSYVMVLASVIVGLGITHLLQGIAGLVQHPGRERVYWIHLVWAGATFLRAIFWWWFEFRLSETVQWTFTLYFFVLTYAFLIYLWCALLFPRDLVGYDGYRDYFYSRKAWFFGVGFAGVAVDVGDTLLKGIAHFQSLGLLYPGGDGNSCHLVHGRHADSERTLSWRTRHILRHLFGRLSADEPPDGAMKARD